MKRFLQIVLCAIVILSAQSAWAADIAEIAIPTNSNLRVGVLRPGALLHSNREYTFPTVPDELNELAYTAHPHRATRAVHLEVTKSGLLYLCIEGNSVQGNENILEKLGLTDWKKLDSKKPLGRPTRVGDSADWAVWSKQVKAGDKLSIPSVDRWGSIVCAAKITGLDIVVPSSRGSSGSPTTVDKIEQVVLSESNEYDILKEQIAKLSDWNYERVEAEVFNSASLILPEDANPLEIVLRRTVALIADLKSTRASSELGQLATEFENLKRQYKPTMNEDQIRELFDRVVAVRRQIAFTNPLLNFKDILFLKRRKGGGHMCDQYFAHKVPSGGGVFVLKDAFGETPTVENLLAESTIQNGRIEGQYALDGAFVGLELSFDAKTIYFSRSEKQGSAWTPENSFNIYKASVDGSNLTLLTDGPTNDFDPCELPNGRLAFISERIGGYGRCHPRVVPTYTVHGMMADGSDIIPLSYHETNEWNPSVDNNGMIVYSRWDYVDRDSDIAHHIWHMYPDGRDPRSYHGNYPDERRMRPWMELSIRAIPDSHRYIATAAAHHGHNYGSLVMIDERIEDDRAMSQLKRITPEEGFPESEQKPGHMGNKRNEIYATAWPLSENYYICVYDAKGSNYGIYLVDCFGNKELLYRDSKHPCFDPIPLVSRKRPPVIPIKTTQAAADRNDPRADLSMGTVTLMNIYEAEFPFPEGTQIKELRIVNIFPKSTPITNKPNIGKGAQSLCRGVLGTVPVEEDGSAHFEVPTGINIYFQALNENGDVVQTMRSSTYVHPGETLGCIGCHEKKNTMQGGSHRPSVPLAMRRGPSKIKPEAIGSYPLSFPRLVQPILDRKCVDCHEKDEKARRVSLHGDRFVDHGWSESYKSLYGMGWSKSGGNGAIRGNGGCYSKPGEVCAPVSKLYRVLTEEHYGLKLTDEEFRAIMLWIDCNTNFYGAYKETEEQAKGKLIKPEFGLPPHIPFEKLIR